MKSMAVLLTCHNRREKTLRCLTSLFDQQLTDMTVQVYLVDDGSVDGTSTAVSASFPQVKLIQGDGTLYWNGGMRKCWQFALKQQHDFYVLLNDDVTLVHDALNRLVACYNQQPRIGAVIGTMRDIQTERPSYGGRNIRYWFNPMWTSSVLTPGETAIPCDYINGNLCLIPAVAVDEIGVLSERFTHSMGDFDYGIRLRRAGYLLLIAPGYYGFCDSNPVRGSIRDASIPMQVRLGWMSKPNMCPPLEQWLWFIRQYGGLVWPFLYFKAIVGRKFPRVWLWFNQQQPDDASS